MRLTDYPPLVFLVSFVAMWFATWAGGLVSSWRPLKEEVRSDYSGILGGTIGLLALIIGFSFSMSISRYDQRKNLEEEEANAIGTEYLRADFLPQAEAAQARELLKSYLDQRILTYTTRDREERRRIDAVTAKLQSDLWSAVRAPAAAQPTALTGLVASGMNDVLNSQGYTQAAWLNRIPRAAWFLMISIALGCNALIGYGVRSATRERGLRLVLPLFLAVSFMLIADIDSPRGGVIRLSPVNLQSLAASLAAPSPGQGRKPVQRTVRTVVGERTPAA